MLSNMVMLIANDGYSPPFGSIGFILGPMDEVGDYEVFFPDHPCPVAEPTWFCHHTWLKRLNEFTIKELEDVEHI